MSELTLQALGETAASQPTQAACGQPREWWTVVHAFVENADYSSPVLYRSREHAEAVAAVKRFDFPTLAPWRVVRMVEQNA